MAEDVPDHRELASEPIDPATLLMCWQVTLADGRQGIELGSRHESDQIVRLAKSVRK